MDNEIKQKEWFITNFIQNLEHRALERDVFQAIIVSDPELQAQAGSVLTSPEYVARLQECDRLHNQALEAYRNQNLNGLAEALGDIAGLINRH